MALEPREKRAITIGIAAAAVFVGYALGLGPVLAKQKVIRSEIQVQQATLDRYQMIVGRKKWLAEEGKLAEQAVASIQARLLTGERPALAAAELQNLLKFLGNNSQVFIQSEKILQPVAEGYFVAIPVELTLRASMANFTQFLYAIENYAKELQVEDLAIRVDHPTNPRQVVASLVVKGFIRQGKPES